MRLILICTWIKGLEGRNISNLAPSETGNILCKQSAREPPHFVKKHKCDLEKFVALRAASQKSHERQLSEIKEYGW